LLNPVHVWINFDAQSQTSFLILNYFHLCIIYRMYQLVIMQIHSNHNNRS